VIIVDITQVVQKVLIIWIKYFVYVNII